MPNLNGADLLNTIRANASAEYVERIPEATDDNISLVGEAILNFDRLSNEFVNSLVNRIGLVILNSKVAHNPLAPLKKGKLSVGETIEEVFTDIVKAQVYNPIAAVDDLFKRNLPNVQVVFHKINSELKYQVTVSEAQLRRAFTSYDSLERFITSIIESLYKSATYDEFLYMKKLIKAYADARQFSVVTIPAITDKASAEEAMIAIKTVSDAMEIFGPNFNYAGVHTSTSKDKQYLITTPDINARLNVQVLAQAFHMNEAEFAGHIIVVDELGGLDATTKAILVDEAWVQVYDTLRMMKTVENGSGLYWNYFYHVWMIYSTSPFANAVLFTTETADVNTVTVTPETATLKPGDHLDLTVNITSTISTGSRKCTYEITGATSNETYVTPMGRVVLAPNETGATITVTATSVVDTSKSGTCTITLDTATTGG